METYPNVTMEGQLAQPFRAAALAWNPMPTGSVFDCFTIWGSTDFATWIPVVTVSSNVTMTTFIQTNASEFFVIRAENQSAPSNIVTNPVIKTK